MTAVEKLAVWTLSRRFVLLFCPGLLLVLLISSLSIAQTATSGGLTGVVTDPSGAVVVDAYVEIKNDSKGITQSATTDRGGVYRFFFLPPARYALSVSHTGFRTESRTLTVPLGPPVSVNVTLQVAEVAASLSVIAEAPLVNAENGDVSTTMNAQQISEVPNPGNDITYIAQTAPGAIMNTDGVGYGGVGNFSILGMPGTSTLFTLNGMNDNNIQLNTNNSGVTGMMLGQNEIQEATIVSNGYSVQFGGAAGASVNYQTKSGSNKFHGNAQYYWNGTALNANDWIDNAVSNPRPLDIAHQWAGSLGGAIKKDKLFFFLNSEGSHILLPNSFQVVLPSPEFESATLANLDAIFPSTLASPSASHSFYQQMFSLYNNAPGASTATLGNFNPGDLGCYGWIGPQVQGRGLGTTDYCSVHFSENVSVPYSDSIASGKVDWNAGASDRIFLFVQNGRGQNPIHVDPISPLFNAYCNQSTWQGQLSETHTLGPSAANQFLLAGTLITGPCGITNSARALATFPLELSWFSAGIPFALLGGYDAFIGLSGGSTTAAYQISDDWVRARGKHKFGLGVNFLRTDLKCCGYNSGGIGLLLPLSMSAFFDGGVGSNPSMDFTILQQTYPLVTWNYFAFYSLGLYGQDEWHVRPNLTLTLALRADHQSNPVCENHCFVRLSGPLNSISHDPNQPYRSSFLLHQTQAFPNTDSLVWSPRFSFAWQPRGVLHNIVMRGGVGVFYDPVPGQPGTNLGGNPPLLNSFNISGYNLAPGETNSLSQNANASNAAFTSAFLPGSSQTLSQIQAVDPNFSPPSFVNPPNALHSPQYQKWSLQVQQSLGAFMSLTVSYFGNHGIHEFAQNPNANAFGFGSYPKAVCSSPPVAPCADPRLGGVTEYETSAVSNYNGMVVSFEHRLTRLGSGVFQINYTYGHVLDEVSNGGIAPFTTGGSSFPQDANNLRGSYGAAEYDARHSLTGNYVWDVPLKAALGGHGPGSLVKSWQISGTIVARSGYPYTVTDPVAAGDLSKKNFFGTIYSVPAAPLGHAEPCGKGAAIPVVSAPCQPPQMANGSPAQGALFVQSGCETGFDAGHLGASGVCDGDLVSFAQGRNRFRGPGFVNFDFAVMKNTKIPHWENGTLGIGAQFFNFFNHANFGFPDPLSSDSGFGEILNMNQPPTSILGATLQTNAARRMIQLRVQLKF